MANLRPVIASRIGGTSEIIDHQETGLLVEPGNSEELAQAVIHLYNYPQAVLEMIKKARTKVESSFSKEQMINSFEKFFVTLLR
jgi:glycosyltransferase involved in cell wall biosynthesis